MHQVHSPETILLLDDPILPGTALSKKQRLISDMAHDLLKYDAFRNEDDAMRSLFATRKYHAFDVIVCVADAMQVAAQEVVFKAMVGS